MAINIQKRGDGWRLIIEIWGTKTRKTVYPPKQKYFQYGFDPDQSFEEARTQLKAVRAREKLTRERERRATIDKRLEKNELKESAYLPRRLYSEFLDWLKERRLWDVIPPKTESHLRCMRSLILDVDIDPSELPNKPEKVYRWFLKKKLSLSYVEKILPLLNAYGYFYCREMKRPYLPINPPMGDLARRIDDANLAERDGARAESLPLSESLLERLRGLEDIQFRWVRFSFYFGLRPSEVDQLAESKRGKVWEIYQDGKGTPVLKFYQSKLVRVARERRWKRIPAILVAQRNLLIELDAGMRVQRPLVKTLQLRLGEGFGTYAGRKGFEKFMRSKGQGAHVSRWLGHQNPMQTERSYREIEAVEYSPLPEA